MTSTPSAMSAIDSKMAVAILLERLRISFSQTGPTRPSVSRETVPAGCRSKGYPMNAVLIMLAVPAGLWALSRVALSAWGAGLANRRRTRELWLAAGTHGRATPSNDDPIQAIQAADIAATRATREDFSLTGAILAGLGALAMFAGRALAYGPWAVGLYSAGTLAIVVGFGLAILGGVLRMLARPLLDVPRPALDR